MTETLKKLQETANDSQPQAAVAVKKTNAVDGGTWKENLGKYLIDISKYVMTGVIITSIFKDLEDKSVVYLIGLAVALVALIVGLVLTNKKKGD